MENFELNFEKIIENLKEGKNFSFSRWGDGELNCLFGKAGTNCDKHPYDSDLGIKLSNIMMSKQRYCLGIQNLGYKQRKEAIDEITLDMNFNWCNADMLHHASIKGRFTEFIEALKGRDLILVAPERLEKLRTVFPDSLGNFKQIFIPKVNCFNMYSLIRKEIRENCKENVVILYCASMMANVLIDNIFEQHGESLTQIDVGSAFEPYVGHSNRSYHQKIIDNLKEKK